MELRGWQPGIRTMAGIAVVLFAAVLLASGLHHVIRTGTCSSTGYSQYGPVPVCPRGVGAWIAFTGGGIILIVVGGVIARAAMLVAPATFLAVGIGSLTVHFDQSAGSSTRTFALFFGAGFAVLGALGLLLALWASGRAMQSRFSPFGPASSSGKDAQDAASRTR